jgi:hypothetical protein
LLAAGWGGLGGVDLLLVVTAQHFRGADIIEMA